MKIIRIVSLVLKEEDAGKKRQLILEDFKKMPNSPEEAIERAMAARVPHLAIEMDTNVVELKVKDGVYDSLFYIFQLCGVLMKPIENGVEIDIRDREALDNDYSE
jgi:hypothetical protein